MAILQSGNLGLEIRFVELDSENWVQYEILFLYKGEPMVQDHQLKRVNEHWQKRSPGAFKANQYGHDGFIPTIRAALDSDQPQSFTPIDPDITLAIYPLRGFPFIASGWELIYQSEEAEQEEQDQALIREVAGGRLPSDPFTIIFKVDMYNYGETMMYHGEGPALILLVRRHELREFCDELEQEYAAFCQRWGIEEPRD